MDLLAGAAIAPIKPPELRSLEGGRMLDAVFASNMPDTAAKTFTLEDLRTAKRLLEEADTSERRLERGRQWQTWLESAWSPFSPPYQPTHIWIDEAPPTPFELAFGTWGRVLRADGTVEAVPLDQIFQSHAEDPEA